MYGIARNFTQIKLGEHGACRVRSTSIYAQSSTGSTEINRSIK